MLTDSQIKKLGDRLRSDAVDETDLAMLEQFRDSFTESYRTIMAVVGQVVGHEPTGRIKTVPSIIGKLKRDRTRLNRIQDIAGCRLVVSSVRDQDHATAAIEAAFTQVRRMDRRREPNHGYRAVHLIVPLESRFVEIQIRTLLQHRWAELSEALTDVWPGLKYGDGDSDVYQMLLSISKEAATVEEAEGIKALAVEFRGNLGVNKSDLDSAREALMATFDRMMAVVEARQRALGR